MVAHSPALPHTQKRPPDTHTYNTGPLSGAGNKQFMCLCLANVMQYPKNNTHTIFCMFSVRVCWRAIQIFELHMRRARMDGRIDNTRRGFVSATHYIYILQVVCFILCASMTLIKCIEKISATQKTQKEYFIPAGPSPLPGRAHTLSKAV